MLHMHKPTCTSLHWTTFKASRLNNVLKHQHITKHSFQEHLWMSERADVTAEAVKQRSAVGYWLSSDRKALVAQEDLDRISTLTSMTASLAGQVYVMPNFTSEWTSPTQVVQAPQGGLVNALVGLATATASTAMHVASTAVNSAVLGSTPAEVLRNTVSPAVRGTPQQPPQQAESGLSVAAQKTTWLATTLQQEAAMWLFAYSVAVRQAGLQRYLGYAKSSTAAPGATATAHGVAGASEGSTLSTDDGGVADSAAAVKLLRQAAGLFEFIADQALPKVEMVVAGLPEKHRHLVPELQNPVIRSLALTCLAEAQAITTARARDKNSCPALCAGLEAGTAQLYLMARMALSGSPAVPPVAPQMQAMNFSWSPPQTAKSMLDTVKRLRAYLAAAQALHLSRSRYCQALDFADKGLMGFASAAAQEAEAVARQGFQQASRGGGAVSEAAWCQVLEAARSDAGVARNKYENDRLMVTIEPLPRDPIEVSGPKVLVSSIPTAPAPYTPPDLPPEEAAAAAGQNCTVQ